MTVRGAAWGVGVFGAVTALLLAFGADSVGGVFALIQLGLLVGAPLAFMLHDHLRSWQVVLVMAVALSIALSAISVQFLIWFRIATAELVVTTATTYGVVLAVLLTSADLEGDRPSGNGST